MQSKQILIKGAEIVHYNYQNNKWDITKKDVLVVDGIISKIEAEMKATNSDVQVIDGENKLITSGFVNGHTHSYSNILKIYGENHPLESWMFYAFLAGVLDEEDVYISALLGSIEMIKSGVTSTIDHLAQHTAGIESALRAYQDVGLRVSMSPMVTDLDYFDSLPPVLEKEKEVNTHKINEIIEQCNYLVEKWHGFDNDMVRIMPGPSGIQRVSKELLLKLNSLAVTHNLQIHTHFVETKIQSITAYEKYEKSMAEYLSELGVLSSKWTLAHSVWLSDKDIDILAENGVNIIHNPASNLMLGSGIAPINNMTQKGINVALGTDGCNCGGSQNIFRSMSLAAMVSKITTPDYTVWQSADKVLQMATIGGAKAIGMEDSLGTIEVGKKADLVLINKNTTSLTATDNIPYSLVYSELGEAVDTVLVNGEMVMQNRKLTKIDEDEILAAAEERFGRVKEKVEAMISKSKANIEKAQGVYNEYIHQSLPIHRTAHWHSES